MCLWCGWLFTWTALARPHRVNTDRVWALPGRRLLGFGHIRVLVVPRFHMGPETGDLRRILRLLAGMDGKDFDADDLFEGDSYHERPYLVVLVDGHALKDQV